MDIDLSRKRLRERMEEKNITASQLANELGFRDGYFRDFLNGKKKSISADAAARGAKRLEVESDWLLGGSDVMYLEPTERPPGSSGPSIPHLLPVYQPFASEDGRFIFRDAVAEVRCPRELVAVKGAYALQVRGSALEPKYNAGETLFIDPSRAPRYRSPVCLRTISDGVLFGVIGEYVAESPKTVLIRPFAAQKPVPYQMDDVVAIDYIRYTET